MVAIVLDFLTVEKDVLKTAEPCIALGRFLSAWSQLESSYGYAFRKVAGLEPSTAQKIYEKIGVKEQLEILVSIISDSPENDENKQLRATLEGVRKVSVARNKIIHSRWCEVDGEKTRFWNGITNTMIDDIRKDTQKGKTYRKKLYFSVENLNELTDECMQLSEAIRQFLDALLERVFEAGPQAFLGSTGK